MWNDLGLKDKARMIQLAVKSGITDLRTIEEVYNTYASGGKIHRLDDGGPEETLAKYKGTNHDPLQFNIWTHNPEDAESFLINRNIRESEVAPEVADFFRSYASSSGIDRIINNQKEWYKKYHPIRKIVPGAAYDATSEARMLKKNLPGINAEGVFDLDAHTATSGYTYKRGDTTKNITIIGTEYDTWPYGATAAHEMMHKYNYTGLSQGEALDLNVGATNEHDQRRDEKHSDIEALKWILFNKGIYDARGDVDATADDIRKLREILKAEGKDFRSLEQMTDEQAAWMINHVADASEKINTANIAASGGPLLLNHYADGGGLSRSKNYKSSKKPYPSVKSSDFAGGNRSYPIPTKADAVDALRLAGLHHRPDVKAKVYSKYPSLKHADGGPLKIDDPNPSYIPELLFVGPTLEYAGPSLELLGPELTPAARQKITTSDYYNYMANYYEHKYPDKYPNFSYYLRKSGDLRGTQLATNENAFLDYNDSNVIRIKGTESHNVPVTKAVLDSIALNGAMVGISPEEALGIPAQETNFGFYPPAWWEPEQMREWNRRYPGGYALDQEGGITPVELLNDSAYIDNPYGSTLSYLSKKFKVGDPIDDSSNMFITELTEDELDKIETELAKDRAYADKKAKSFSPAGSVFNHAYTLYKSGKYNAGDPNHNSDVYRAGKDVFNSPQIREWWNTSGRKYYEMYAPEILKSSNK